MACEPDRRLAAALMGGRTAGARGAVRVEPLDRPVWESLRGAHASLAIAAGRAARYPAEVSPLAGLAEPGEDALADLAEIVDAGDFAALFLPDAVALGPHWTAAGRIELIQMVGEESLEGSPEAATAAGPELAPLGAADVGDMLALVEETRPGPFGPRTLAMGRYLGVREAGQLVAMGGERLRPPGYTEVSAICTAPGARGRGLARLVLRALVCAIQHRGEVPFLHVMAGSPSEQSAVALYRRLGFRERRRAILSILRRR